MRAVWQRFWVCSRWRASPGGPTPDGSACRCEWGSRSRQPVADPANGLDLSGAELLTEVADVDIDHVGAGVEVVSPYSTEQLFAAENLAGVAYELLGQGELAGAEFDINCADAGATGAHVQMQLAVRQIDRGAG